MKRIISAVPSLFVYNNILHRSLRLCNQHRKLESKILYRNGNRLNNNSIQRNLTQIKTGLCWKCHNNNTNKISFFCESCGIIQDPNNNLDYFKILCLNEDFNIDSTKLTSKFRQLQNMVHPDKYSNMSEREQNNSQEWSSLINKAYKTLQTPIERGQYLLKLKGIDMPKDNSSLNTEFLMEMMERNEEVEEADTIDLLNELLKHVKDDMSIEVKKLEKEFLNNNFNAAKFVLVKMKYLKSLEKSIKDKMEKFNVF